jgi:hypothetical protein
VGAAPRGRPARALARHRIGSRLLHDWCLTDPSGLRPAGSPLGNRACAFVRVYRAGSQLTRCLVCADPSGLRPAGSPLGNRACAFVRVYRAGSQLTRCLVCADPSGLRPAGSPLGNRAGSPDPSAVPLGPPQACPSLPPRTRGRKRGAGERMWSAARTATAHASAASVMWGRPPVAAQVRTSVRYEPWLKSLQAVPRGLNVDTFARSHSPFSILHSLLSACHCR